MRFENGEAIVTRNIFVSATPGTYEAEHQDAVVEQVVRPTGLVDPEWKCAPSYRGRSGRRAA